MDTNNGFNPEYEFKRFLCDQRDEERCQRPSIFFLKSYADKILEIAHHRLLENKISPDFVLTVDENISSIKNNIETDLKNNDDKKFKVAWKYKKNALDNLKDSLLQEYLKTSIEL